MPGGCEEGGAGRLKPPVGSATGGPGLGPPIDPGTILAFLSAGSCVASGGWSNMEMAPCFLEALGPRGAEPLSCAIAPPFTWCPFFPLPLEITTGSLFSYSVGLKSPTRARGGGAARGGRPRGSGGPVGVAPGGKPRGGGAIEIDPPKLIVLTESTEGRSAASSVRGGGATGGGLNATGGAPGGGPGGALLPPPPLPFVSCSPRPPLICTPLPFVGTVGGGPGGLRGGADINVVFCHSARPPTL